MFGEQPDRRSQQQGDADGTDRGQRQIEPAVGQYAGRDHGRQRPDPVVRPRHRGNHQTEERYAHQRHDGCAGRQHPSNGPDRHTEGRAAGQCPQHEVGVFVQAESGQCAGDVLIGVQSRRPDPIGIDDGGGPVLHRVPPGQRATDRGGGSERHHRRQRRAQVPAQHEIEQEDGGRQLEGYRHTQQQSARPRGTARQTVGDHQRHQHDVDLSEGEVGPDRFQRRHRCRDNARRQPAPLPPRRPTGGAEDPQTGQHQPDRHPQQPQSDGGEHHARHRQRHQGQRAEHDRRQGRIGERQIQPAAGREGRAIGVQRPALQPGLTPHAIDVGVDAVGKTAEEVPARVGHGDADQGLRQAPRGPGEPNVGVARQPVISPASSFSQG